MKKKLCLKQVTAMALCAGMTLPSLPASAAQYEFRSGKDGKLYWYENNVKQGTVDDKQGILGDGTNRGREIYDPATNGWYWLDSVYDGAKAEGKEVWIPYIYQDELIMNSDGMGRIANGIADESKIAELAALSITDEADMSAQVADAIRSRCGKWVRYDEKGCMLKGWVVIEGALADCYPNQIGNIYYYDQKTGLMAKGNVTINGVEYHFNEMTGVLDSGEKPELKFIITSQKQYLNSDTMLETIYEQGKPVKRIDHVSDGTSYISIEYIYDEKGNLIKEIYYEPDGTIGSETFYDKDGHITKSVGYYSEYTSTMLRDYDSNGLLAEERTYVDGELDHMFLYSERDENGNKLKVETYRADGKLSSVYVYEWADDGKTCYSTRYDVNGNVMMYTITKYFKRSDSEELESYYERRDGNGKTVYVEETDYDEHGNMIAWRELDSDGNLKSSCEYTNEYDSYGNLLKTTQLIKDSEGKVTMVFVTEYTYALA